MSIGCRMPGNPRFKTTTRRRQSLSPWLRGFLASFPEDRRRIIGPDSYPRPPRLAAGNVDCAFARLTC